MKFHLSTTTLAIYVLFIILWVNLFTHGMKFSCCEKKQYETFKIKEETPKETDNCGICLEEMELSNSVERMCQNCKRELCPECFKLQFQDRKHNCPFCRYFPVGSQVKINRPNCTMIYGDDEDLPGELFGFVDSYDTESKEYIVTATTEENLNVDFTAEKYKLTIKPNKPTSTWRCLGDDLYNLTPQLLNPDFQFDDALEVQQLINPNFYELNEMFPNEVLSILVGELAREILNPEFDYDEMHPLEFEEDPSDLNDMPPLEFGDEMQQFADQNPEQHNVKMIFATTDAFEGLLPDGNFVAWGNPDLFE